jgi:hypothetical protein
MARISRRLRRAWKAIGRTVSRSRIEQGSNRRRDEGFQHSQRHCPSTRQSERITPANSSDRSDVSDESPRHSRAFPDKNRHCLPDELVGHCRLSVFVWRRFKTLQDAPHATRAWRFAITEGADEMRSDVMAGAPGGGDRDPQPNGKPQRRGAEAVATMERQGWLRCRPDVVPGARCLKGRTRLEGGAR